MTAWTLSIPTTGTIAFPSAMVDRAATLKLNRARNLNLDLAAAR
jgi:hypothetical protein